MRKTAVFYTAYLLLFLLGSVVAGEASVPTETNEIAQKYTILMEDDLDRYQKIFALQKKERWSDADKVIKKLDNDILMGYVLAQRYLLSGTWKTKQKEVESWLKKYGDLPFAGKVYDLGIRKGAKFNFKRPKDVDNIPAASCGSYFSPNPIDLITNRKFSGYAADKAKAAKKLMVKIRSAINRGKTLIAFNLINSSEAKVLFRASDIDAAKTALAFLYFTELRDNKALEMIEPAANRSGKTYPIAYWVAGLVYWRVNDYEKAFENFKKAAESPKAKPSIKSASAYWASRAALKIGEYGESTEWLEKAAQHKSYFYGILAQRSLGQDIGLSWKEPETSYYDEERLVGEKAVQRAVALFQLGKNDKAENEFLSLYVKSSDEEKRGLINLAESNGLEELASVMVSIEGKTQSGSKRMSFPAPHWQPEQGWKAEKALVYAFVRQESCFNNKAVSSVGARGLMQLMPATARETARFLGLDWSQKKLAEPSYNLELGQAYLLRLTRDRFINQNLMFLAVAYNSGPGNLYKWSRRMSYNEDPLLFMESIPSKETRTFVEKILTNYWIYSSLFASDGIDSLDQVIDGQWPMYNPSYEYSQFVGSNKQASLP